MAVEQLIITLISLFFAPIIIILSLIILLASVGKSIGVRRKYVECLLKVFEWGQTKIAKHNERRRASRDEGYDSEREDKENRPQTDTVKKKLEDGATQESLTSKNLIKRDFKLTASGRRRLRLFSQKSSLEILKHEFQLDDVMPLCKTGLESIIEDDVTSCFSAEELTSWNFLSRTNSNYQFISLRLTVMWCVGIIFRYFILLPMRLLIAGFGISWMLVSTAFIGYLPSGRFKGWLNRRASLMCYRILARAFSATITFHNRENMAHDGICVANHTSPIDVLILATDNCYAMIGQCHGGFLGLLQRAMARATSHIWFERSEMKDRLAVTNRLKDHVSNPSTLPILIFPEGTCINNTSVMMFKKGSFEVGGTVYPVAIKYDPRFSDTFWNSSKQSMTKHLLLMMTSWAIVCDVWYLPPETKKEEEDAVMFANRMKSIIASQGGLVDLEWDGGLKRNLPKAAMKEKQQAEISKLIKLE